MQKGPGENPYKKLDSGGYLGIEAQNARNYPRINPDYKTFQQVLDEAKAQGEYLCAVWTPGGSTQEVCVLGSQNERHFERYFASRGVTFHRVPADLVPEAFFKEKE